MIFDDLPFDDDIWDEERWEAFLRDHDKLLNRYMELIFQFTQQYPQTDPDDAEAFKNRGAAYGFKGEYDQAIRDLDQAIRMDPDDAGAFNNRGWAYYKKGQVDSAISDYDQAIRLRPDHALAFNNKGLALNEKARILATSCVAYRRDGNEAVRLAQEAVRLLDDPRTHDTLAAAYAETGRFDAAVTAQKRAIEMMRTTGWSKDAITDAQNRLDVYRRGQSYCESELT